MIHIQIQAHPNCVGGDQIVNLAILIEVHLSIPRAGAERPHDHCRPALLTAQQFRDSVDTIDREPDDGTARGHPADLFRPGIDQLRHPLTPDKLHLGHQSRNGAAHGVGPQKQRLARAARPQQAVGENMAAFRVGTELDFVDGYEIGTHAFGHRLDRADPILGARGHDPFFARDKRHDRRPANGDDLVINLAREQTQRQANDTGPVAQHTFNRVMRFTCVRRAQYGHDSG